MNFLWQEKFKELNELDKEQAWYIVKHNPEIIKLCYYVSFLEEFQNDENIREQYNVEKYIKKRIEDLNAEKNWVITPNYRTLMVASYYGLILKTAQKGDKYDNASITETFQEIKARCNGKFENIKSYNDIIQRQIEKIFITTPLDDEFEGRRREYKLFPVIYLYKILLELGKSTGKYTISMIVYNTLILTSHKYQDFLETLLLIKLLDTEKETLEKLKNEIGSKFSIESRWNRTLELLDTLEVTSDSITLKKEYIQDVAKKIFLFETNKLNIDENNYLQFLGSTKSLVDEVVINPISPSTQTPTQIIFYGVPGSGKSHSIKKELAAKGITDLKEQTKRVVFHPEYTNADFVGQILPQSSDGGKTISYPFVPGPFTQILAKAYTHQNTHYALIIEEINRGNAAAIFGELFQLLDRLDEDETEFSNEVAYTKGWSSYSINNDNINKAIQEAYNNSNIEPFIDKKIFDTYKLNIGIRLPPNLSIFATMNTSDQNVFKLDNAFKRRWKLKLIPNKFNDEPKEKNQRDAVVEGFDFTWNNFREAVNSLIIDTDNSIDISSFADRQIGCWFTKAIKKDEKYIIEKEVFVHKVLEYLWDDVCNGDIGIFFKETYKSFAELVEDVIEKKSTDIFSENLKGKLSQNKPE